MMVMPVPTVPVMAMMPAMPMMPVVVMPVHLGGGLPGIILYRAGGARIDQRYRTRALNRSGGDEECASRHQAQNFRSVHFHLPRLTDIAPAPHLGPTRRDVNRFMAKDVNAD